MEGQRENDSENELGKSFRQSRKEFRFQLITWAVFAAWTLAYNSFRSGDDGEEGVSTILGMPEWAFYGIALPWSLALGVTIWFALFFMKDTPLGEEEECR